MWKTCTQSFWDILTSYLPISQIDEKSTVKKFAVPDCECKVNRGVHDITVIVIRSELSYPSSNPE